jgi:hypothetical protein
MVQYADVEVVSSRKQIDIEPVCFLHLSCFYPPSDRKCVPHGPTRTYKMLLQSYYTQYIRRRLRFLFPTWIQRLSKWDSTYKTLQMYVLVAWSNQVSIHYNLISWSTKSGNIQGQITYIERIQPHSEVVKDHIRWIKCINYIDRIVHCRYSRPYRWNYRYCHVIWGYIAINTDRMVRQSVKETEAHVVVRLLLKLLVK